MKSCLAILALFLSSVLAVLAGPGPNYSYGEAWWDEYDSDQHATLLLHFGRPVATNRAQLAKEVKQKRTDENLGEEDGLEAALDAPAVPLPKVSTSDFGLPPVDDKQVPAGTLLDYSDARKSIRLPAGAKTVPEGRFGEGLVLDGSGPGLRVDGVSVGGGGAVEFWLKVPAYPAKPACILSMDKDESKLLLLPNGRLELVLRQPHGYPMKSLTETQVAQILQRDPTIRTSEPLPLDTWQHVVVLNKEHVVQGVGSPFDAMIMLNGWEVANYLSENGNGYNFFGRGQVPLVLGNSYSKDQPFAGQVDELRVSTRNRVWYERPTLTWRDATATRPLQFDKPFFRSSGTVLHLPFDLGTKLALATPGGEQAQIELKGASPDLLKVSGVRGVGWVADPAIGLPRIPLKGMSAQTGALEFWVRPTNWDDVTGYWHHSPPNQLNLGVARVMARLPGGEPFALITLNLPRAHNIERGRVPLDPGHWLHVAIIWHEKSGKWASVFHNGKSAGGTQRAQFEQAAKLELLYLEFGIKDDVTVKRGEHPRIEIDEVVGYRTPLAGDEVQQAYTRWQRELTPINLYRDDLSFKYSLQRLEYQLMPLLPEGQEPAMVQVRVTRGDGSELVPARREPLVNGSVKFRLHDGPTLPQDKYTLAFSIMDGAGKELLTGQRVWTYQEEEWRHYQGGILDQPMPPWTPIVVAGQSLSTLMTRYELGPDGLPVAIFADGQNLLQAPVRLLEAGQPMVGKLLGIGPTSAVDSTWRAQFTGKTCDLTLVARLEYEGMTRWEWTLTPKGPQVAPLSLEIPLKSQYGTHYLYHSMGDRGVTAGEIGDKATGKVLESRIPKAPYSVWKAYKDAQAKDKKLTWEAYWEPIKTKTQAYNFFGHLDVNDRNRGLWWFADNAAGWHQSKTVSALELERGGDALVMRLNLIAEPVAYESTRPIVFGLLPHPAKPLAPKYRLLERAPAAQEPLNCIIFDAFRPWPMDPRDGSMKLYPAADPKNKEAGPSWDYAERCLPSMKSNQVNGYRTLYLSKAYFSCRAGAYDQWEWRSGEGTTVSLTPYFINYLCWEINGWLSRGIWNSIYLDECYEHPATNLEAGFSVRLPDGSEQPGVTNFAFRELMKRWRGLFVQNGLEPMMSAHHTYSWQYPGLVWCDATLDGENAPIVSLNSRDWIDSTSKTRYEVLQNARLWGVATFYMPFVSEGGFDDKNKSQFLRWQWRMARQAQSSFAHYETATVYEGQGSQVYKAYWQDLFRWGGGDPQVAKFHPYWDNAALVEAAGQGQDLLISCYVQKGKVLLIASNRKKEPITASIKLNLAALGLPTTLTAKEWDSGFEPPEGDDFHGLGNVQKETEALLEASDALALEKTAAGADQGLFAEPLADKTQTAAAERAKLAPKLTGDTLLLPIRARDFRIIALE